jgi:hypothetical protein
LGPYNSLIGEKGKSCPSMMTEKWPSWNPNVASVVAFDSLPVKKSFRYYI